ncbi:MAG: F0F1 ATP synthase subunit delta [Methylocystaceae bacterium]|nr:MAG: F0F1 ATP synthase subunit delta [Methylocystaceae bacterium]
MASRGDDLSGVAGRYASALYDLASERGSTEEVAEALRGFSSLIDESKDLQRLVKSPVFSAQEQIKALDPILAGAEISGVAANLIRLVAAKRRLFVLPAIIAAYQRLHDAARGVVRADVTVAAPLAAHHESALREALAGVTGGKEIDLAVKVDPSIIGGGVVKIGSRMLDASLKTKLNSIRTRMKEVG